MHKVELIFDDNISTIQTMSHKEFEQLIQWFRKRKVFNFGNVLIADLSKVKIIRVLSNDEGEQA